MEPVTRQRHRRRRALGRRLVRAGVLTMLLVIGVGGLPAPVSPTRLDVSTTADVLPLSPRLSTWRGSFVQDGRVVQPTGLNAFGATTWYSTNWGCGSPVTDLDMMFSRLRPHSLVRTWAFQALGWNNKQAPQQQDFFALDRVVQAAERNSQQLVLVLSDQAGTCDDGHWHGSDWYGGDYRQPHPDDGRGLGDRSFQRWVIDVVTRYRDSPAVALWEPVNEPQAADCQGATGGGCDAAHLVCPVVATASLRQFYDQVGGLIHRLAPGALVGLGAQGGGECGLAADGYRQVLASPGIDVASYHDYGAQEVALPSGLQDRLAQARDAGKPLLVGEVGLTAGSGCRSLPQRAHLAVAKARAALRSGAGGWLPWWYSEQPGPCGDDFGPSDPMIPALQVVPGRGRGYGPFR